MAEKQGIHEDLHRAHEVAAGSERTFGLVFAAVFALIGLWPLTGGAPVRPWALGLTAIFMLFALVRPVALRPLNLLWHRFGMLLNSIVSPLVMGVLFFLTVTPMALIMRIAGKDPLRLRFDRQAKSYWIERDPPGPDPDSMKNQF
ncbi:MAG: hypothetical protein CMF63_06780 [Magnetovibrio sp.]|nr:hypothetical protein [Magnetovibrio sp.]